jgi:hypothetical protein
MKLALRRPARNAAILGLLTGAPQGFFLVDREQLAQFEPLAGSGLLLATFGLLVPPSLAVFSHFANGKNLVHRWASRVSEFVDSNLFVFWGGVSMGFSGLLMPTVRAHSGASAVCAFFIGSGFGFLLAALVDRYLKKVGVNAT